LGRSQQRLRAQHRRTVRPHDRLHRGRLSGPLLDRVDIVVEVPPVDVAALSRFSAGELSETVRARVVAARELQRARFGPAGPSCNARMTPRDLEHHVELTLAIQRILERAMATLSLSPRGFDRIRRVARTLADLEGEDVIEERHVAEAVQYKRGSAGVGIVGT
jgi:magnesium chelatase family protein